MPQPVRVDPLGDLHAVAERGAVWGNRGVLHADDGTIVRGWQGRRWIACVLEFRGRRRPSLPPGGYTGLFFRDEATALAAGHRPCAECRRADFDAFLAAVGERSADTLDRHLHAERLIRGARPRDGVAAGRRFTKAVADDLVPGVIVRDAAATTWVVADDGPRRWAFGALGRGGAPQGQIEVVTPPAAVAALRGGYVPRRAPLVARG